MPYMTSAFAVKELTPTRSNEYRSRTAGSSSGHSRYVTSYSGGVAPASVRRPSDGMLAMTRARSTKPGSVTPSRCSRSLYTRTPLTAINPILATLMCASCFVRPSVEHRSGRLTGNATAEPGQSPLNDGQLSAVHDCPDHPAVERSAGALDTC